ncbi:MAG: hypothetical protein ACTSR2_03655 [Candidatus Hodarchaeales archaeon]
MKSNLKLYGPNIPDAVEALLKLTRTIEVKGKIPISSGEAVIGKYNFSFTWSKDPEPEPLLLLIEKIDETLEPLPTRYSITTESLMTNRERLIGDTERNIKNTIFSFIRIHGPSLSKAVRAIEDVVCCLDTTNTLDTLKSSILIGEFDYAFEWDHYPTLQEVNEVLKAIDEKIKPTGAIYTITTRQAYRSDKLIDDQSSDNLMAFL